MSTPEQPQVPPCTPWITADDVAAVCDALDTSGGTEVYDEYAQKAYEALFEASGRRFSGECGPVAVRPCDPGWYCRPDHPCGCCRLSKIRLSGYPIREITEVLIDGVAIDSSEYRLDSRQFLVRLADADGNRQTWPGCQRLDLADTEEDTFSVTYTYGQDVPLLGQNAAAELACQLARYSPDGSGDCDLPDGTVTVTRQGVTINLEQFVEVGVTALPFVNLFLRTYNPHGLRRRPAVFTPDLVSFPRQVG